MSKESDLRQNLDAWQGKDKEELNAIFDSISEAGFGMKVTVKEGYKFVKISDILK